MGEVKIDDIIRIHVDAKVSPSLRGLLANVTKVRTWGMVAEVLTPNGCYPVRLAKGDFAVDVEGSEI